MNGQWNNLSLNIDVNGDGRASPHDVLHVLNELEHPRYVNAETHQLPDRIVSPVAPDVFTPLLDVNADGLVTPHDALLVINRLPSSHSPAASSLVMNAIELPNGTIAPEMPDPPVSIQIAGWRIRVSHNTDDDDTYFVAARFRSR